MQSERAMKKAITLLPLSISERVRRLVAEALDAERWAGMEEAAEIAVDRRKLYVGSDNQVGKVAGSMCGIIGASIRAKIEAEKKEAGR